MNRKYKPHIHAELIKAWADGYEIEFKTPNGEWKITSEPGWGENCKYRLYDPLRDVNIGDWLIHIRSKCVYKIIDIKKDRIIFNNFILNPYNIDNDYKKATKEEVLNADNVIRYITSDDFPFEENDWVIREGNYAFQYSTFLSPIDKYLRYATKREIENSIVWKELGIKKGDWVIHKDGILNGYRAYRYGIHMSPIRYNFLRHATKEEIKSSSNWKQEQLIEIYHNGDNYVPFESQDRIFLIGQTIIETDTLKEYFIVNISTENDNYPIAIINSKEGRLITFKELLRNYTFSNKIPCGKIKV